MKEYKGVYPLQMYELDVSHDSMSMGAYFAAKVCDMCDKVIVDAIIQVAKEAGIAKLFLIDKDFILSAIKEKMERDGGRDD